MWDTYRWPMATIGLFMYDLARTGVVANAVRLANGLAATGHRVVLLVLDASGRANHALDPSIAVEVAGGLAARVRLPRGLALPARVPALRRTLRQLAPDILLSAGNHAHAAAMLASAGLPGMRRVLRISNELAHVGDGQLRRWCRRVVHKAMFRRADRLLLVSQHLARDPLLSGAVDEGRAVVAANGVAFDHIRRQAASPCTHPWLDGSVPFVVAVGRTVPHKNFATLIRAFAVAAGARPLRLLIVGGGSAAERRRLEALAAELGVSSAVRLEGEVANPMPLVAASAAFVLPSLWEGASNALLEALACGRPVIASRTAGNAQEVLGYGRYGLLVEPHDVSGMAQAILYQTSGDPVVPGARAADFPAAAAIARACRAITDFSTADTERRPSAAWPERA